MTGSLTSPIPGLRARSALLSLTAFTLALALVCPSGAGAAGAQIQVTVSILPQAWFVQEIGGDLVEVSVLVGPGHSPATYEPTPKQMAVLEGADLFLAAGVPFETGLVPRIRSLARAPVIAGPEAGAHDHDHHETDPHTWLDPIQAAAMADTISRRLQELVPGEAETIRERQALLTGRLADLDERIRGMLADCGGRSFFVFHPAFGHFAHAFGLDQVAVEAGGHEPGPRHLAEVIESARRAQARAVVVQPQFSRKAAETVAEAIGAGIVVLDPLARDYPENLLKIASALAEACDCVQKEGGS